MTKTTLHVPNFLQTIIVSYRISHNIEGKGSVKRPPARPRPDAHRGGIHEAFPQYSDKNGTCIYPIWPSAPLRHHSPSPLLSKIWTRLNFSSSQSHGKVSALYVHIVRDRGEASSPNVLHQRARWITLLTC